MMQKYYLTTEPDLPFDGLTENVTRTPAIASFFDALGLFEQTKQNSANCCLYAVDDAGKMRQIVYFERIATWEQDGASIACMRTRQEVETSIQPAERDIYRAFYRAEIERSYLIAAPTGSSGIVPL